MNRLKEIAWWLLFVALFFIGGWVLMLSTFYLYVASVTVIAVHFGEIGMYIFTGLYMSVIIWAVVHLGKKIK